jgi:N-acetylglucosaminyldiphosphoundecaprenol N-acetyl-beta-D-mannosaminyltransferase
MIDLQLPKVKVLDVSLYGGDIPSASALIIQKCQEQERADLCISATGAHGMVFSKKNPFFKSTLDAFFLNLPDGMPGVWVGRIKGASKMRRCYGPDVFKYLMEKTSDQPITHFFCGGNPGVADELKLAVARKFKNHNVVGTYCPPYLPVEKYNYDEIALQIKSTNPDIIWIGLSTPKQELFALNLRGKAKGHFIITVGAAFDFHTDKVAQAPALMQKLSLEWLFRLVMEPRRLYKRYLEIVPLFVIYNVKELIKFALSQKK